MQEGLLALLGGLLLEALLDILRAVDQGVDVHPAALGGLSEGGGEELNVLGVRHRESALGGVRYSSP